METIAVRHRTEKLECLEKIHQLKVQVKCISNFHL